MFFLMSQFFGLLGNIFTTTTSMPNYYHLLMKFIASNVSGLWLLAITLGIAGAYILFILKTNYKRTELENAKIIRHEDFLETEKLINDNFYDI